MAQKWPKMTQNGPKWPKYDPKWPKNDPHFFRNFIDWKGGSTNFFAFRMYGEMVGGRVLWEIQEGGTEASSLLRERIRVINYTTTCKWDPLPFSSCCNLECKAIFNRGFFQMRWCHLTSISCSKCSMWSLRLASLISNNSNLYFFQSSMKKCDLVLGAGPWDKLTHFFLHFFASYRAENFLWKEINCCILLFLLGKLWQKTKSFEKFCQESTTQWNHWAQPSEQQSALS